MNRLLWILNGCGLEGGSVTGGPVRFHEISRRWQGGVEQRLMTTPGGERMLRRMGCAIEAGIVPASLFLRREPFRAFRLWSYIVTAFAWRRRRAAFDRFLRDGGADLPPAIVTVSDYFCDIFPAVALKRRTGARWTAWIHHRETPPSSRPGNRLANELTYRLQEWSLRRIARHADAAWVYDTEAGDLVRARLAAFGMEPARIRTMRCGVNVSDIAAAPEPPAKVVDAAMVGVRPNKGLFDILPVWERVLARRPGTTLRLMGGMSGEGEVLAEIRRRGLDGVISAPPPGGGLLPAETYYSRLKEARVLFAPSHEEGWGIAVCEAMAAGVPVVAYDLPVYRRIYGDAFRKVTCFDHDAFADAIVSLLDDKAAWAAARRIGLEKAAGFDWSALAADDFAALFR